MSGSSAKAVNLMEVALTPGGFGETRFRPIENAADLSASVQRHWVCSLRQIAKGTCEKMGGKMAAPKK